MKSDKRVCALGFFDGVHLGHSEIIKNALSLAASLDASPCAVTFDCRPKTVLSGEEEKLISPDRAKRKLISVLFPEIETVTLGFTPEFARLSPEEFIESVLERQLSAVGAVAGRDYRFGKNASGDIGFLKNRMCAELVETVMKDGKKVSSTEIRSLLEKGDFDTALEFLGHPFLLGGTVSHGDGRGRNIGFATLNLPYDSKQLYPASGVYASLAEVDGALYPAVTNLGCRPTFYDDGEFTNETHIIDGAPQLYGKEVWVWLCGYIRKERKFTSAIELKAQVDEDIAAAKAIFSRKSDLTASLGRMEI